ncbi:hypothetical protein HRbin04_00964 [archaeon HR04]|nr:hypothetical protein HRbin04_00964 [archaeon HR04]
MGIDGDNNNALAYLERLFKKAEMNLAIIVVDGNDINDIDLSIKGKSNTIYILELDTGSSVAGGRVGGFGSRRFKIIHLFRLEDGRCVKMKSIELEGDDDKEEVDAVVGGGGGYVVRLPIRFDGREVMASCLIDQYAVRLLNSRFGIV